MSEAVSIREFARRDGCSDMLVRRGIKDGRLPVLPTKKVDTVYLGTTWRTQKVGVSEKATAANIVVRVEDGETVAEAAERLTPTLMTQFSSKADAEVVKETFLALLRKLEFDEKSREVVRISEVARIVAAEYAKVRARLMELPSAIAPIAALMTSPEEVRNLIQEEIARALEELAYDGTLGTNA